MNKRMSRNDIILETKKILDCIEFCYKKKECSACDYFEIGDYYCNLVSRDESYKDNKLKNYLENILIHFKKGA